MTSRWTRLSGGLIATVGGVLAFALFLDSTASPDPVYRAVESYPIVLSLLLVGAGVLLARGRLIEDRFLRRLLAWVVIGTLALSLLVVYLYSLMVVFAGHEPLDTPVGVITSLVFGTLVGFLVGVYDSRAYERKHAVEQLSQVNDTLRIATGELVDRTDRNALERAICARLVESDAYRGAWIGRYDPDEGSVCPTARVGFDDTSAESLAVPVESRPAEASVYERAISAQEVRFVPNALADGDTEREWPPSDRGGGEPMAVVPIVGVDCVYGLLGVYASQRSGFDDTERQVFAELGETVGRAIDSIRAGEELERRERELLAHNERLERFASVVSHDLRNPLNVILAQVEFMREDRDEGHLDSIARAGDRMEEIIEDLLALSRAGQTVDDPESVALAPLVHASWENVDTDGAELELRISDGTAIEADPARLMNVFENLFRNAVEHNDPPVTVHVGTIEPTVTANDRESQAGFFVEDDGDGIPVEEHDTVFDYGYTTSTGGTGFGLSIAEGIVEAHGWTVSVAEGVEGGARFEIRTTAGSAPPRTAPLQNADI